MIVGLVNGSESAGLPADDRGLAYGDGIFRTLRMHRAQAVDWQRQYAKLAHDCAALGIVCPDVAPWQHDFAKIAERCPDCVLKLIVTRGPAGRGYRAAPAGLPSRLSLAFNVPNHPPEFEQTGVRIRVCSLRLSRQPRLAGIKHLNRLENVLARSEWDEPSIAEGLLFDDRDELVGGTMSNVFLFSGGYLRTPDLAGAGVAGVQRARIIEVAARLNINVQIGRVSRDDLASADAILLCNSVFGIWGVRQLEDRLFQPHPLIPQLRAELERV